MSGDIVRRRFARRLFGIVTKSGDFDTSALQDRLAPERFLITGWLRVFP